MIDGFDFNRAMGMGGGGGEKNKGIRVYNICVLYCPMYMPIRVSMYRHPVRQSGVQMANGAGWVLGSVPHLVKLMYCNLKCYHYINRLLL